MLEHRWRNYGFISTDVLLHCVRAPQKHHIFSESWVPVTPAPSGGLNGVRGQESYVLVGLWHTNFNTWGKCSQLGVVTTWSLHCPTPNRYSLILSINRSVPLSVFFFSIWGANWFPDSRSLNVGVSLTFHQAVSLVLPEVLSSFFFVAREGQISWIKRDRNHSRRFRTLWRLIQI